jgi:hypothetical protein
MPENSKLIEEMETRANHLAKTEGASEIFHILLEGAALAAPRAGLYLVRKGVLKGWGTRGYDREAAERFQSLAIEENGEWPAALIRPGGPETEARSDDLGESKASTVAAGGRVVAVIQISRENGQEPWHPEIIGLLSRVAEMRLELDLARRKIERLSREKAAEPEAATAVPPASVPPAEPEPEEAPEADSGIEPVQVITPDGEAPEKEDPALIAARRFARLVATDIRLYNEEAVMMGRKNKDLGERLKDQIKRGTEAFLRRYPDLGNSGDEILWEAYIQVLGAGDTTLFPERTG